MAESFSLKSFFYSLWRIGRGYWISEERKRAALKFAIIIVLTLCNVYIMVLLNEWKNLFYNALQNYDMEAFIAQMLNFFKLAGAYLVVAMLIYYFQQTLMLEWRLWLTEHFIDKWLHNKRNYYLQFFGEKTDNPDQRISEDCRLFVTFALKFTIGILNAVVTFFSFIFILWKISGVLTFTMFSREFQIPGYVVWVAILYSVAGTFLIHILGRKLSFLNFSQQKYEADFRFGLIRVRENAESIVLYGGENFEGQHLRGKFRILYENFKRIIAKEKQLIGFRSFYFQLANVFPVLVAAPMFLAKKITLGGLISTSREIA